MPSLSAGLCCPGDHLYTLLTRRADCMPIVLQNDVGWVQGVIEPKHVVLSVNEGCRCCYDPDMRAQCRDLRRRCPISVGRMLR